MTSECHWCGNDLTKDEEGTIDQRGDDWPCPVWGYCDKCGHYGQCGDCEEKAVTYDGFCRTHTDERAQKRLHERLSDYVVVALPGQGELPANLERDLRTLVKR